MTDTPRIVRGFLVMENGDCEGRIQIPGSVFEHRETIPILYPQDNGPYSGKKPDDGRPITIYLGRPTKEDIKRMIDFEQADKKAKKIAQLKKQIEELEGE